MPALPTLMAGPLSDLGARLRLGRRGLGLAIAAVLWCVLIGLAAAEGALGGIMVLPVLAGHVRLLVALPLILASESMVESALGPFVRGLVDSDIVRGAAAPGLRRACDRFNRLMASRPAEGLLLAAAVLPAWLAVDVATLGVTAAHPAGPGVASPLAGQWYWLVCLPAFRFVLLRALFRLGVWYVFLWRLSRLALNLMPTHPDRAAGLGFTAEVQLGFLPMAAAAAAVVSAAIAEDLAARGGPLQAHAGTIIVTLLGCLAVFVAPLYVFAGQLWRVRLLGRAGYGDIAARYMGAFDAKWRGDAAPGAGLLGSADIQSLADMGNSVRVIEEMRVAPVSWGLAQRYALAVVVPMLPLLLFEFPVQEIAVRLLGKLLGE